MIKLEISKKSPQKVYAFSTPPATSTPWINPANQYAGKTGGTDTFGIGFSNLVARAMARDKDIKGLAHEVPYKVDGLARPCNESSVKKYGESVRVRAIQTSYAHFNADSGKWPASNNPMIVTAYSEKLGVFSCTTNYLISHEAQSTQQSV